MSGKHENQEDRVLSDRSGIAGLFTRDPCDPDSVPCRCFNINAFEPDTVLPDEAERPLTDENLINTRNKRHDNISLRNMGCVLIGRVSKNLIVRQEHREPLACLSKAFAAEQDSHRISTTISRVISASVKKGLRGNPFRRFV